MNGSTLADIHAVMDTLEFENDGHIVLRHVSNDQNNIVLLINIKTGVDDAPDQRWQITCVDVRAHRLALQAYCDINISNDYVLLWPYLMPQTAISFYGHIDDPLPIIGALYQQHIEFVGTWIPFDRFLNKASSFAMLLRGTAGMLAEGPEQLMLAYEAVL